MRILHVGASREWTRIERKTKRRARKDARRGINNTDVIVTSTIGEDHPYDPARHEDDRQLQRDLNPQPVEQATRDLRAVERAMTQHPKLWILLLAVTGLLLGEDIAAMLILRGIGVNGPERLPLGAMLAGAMVYVTIKVSRTATIKRKDGTTRPHWSFYLVLLAYVLISAAVTTMRVAHLTPDGNDSVWTELATGIILLALSVGPAWLCEHLFTRLAPTARLYRERSHARKVLRRASNILNNAKTKVAERESRTRAHRDAANRLVALYLLEHRTTSGQNTPRRDHRHEQSHLHAVTPPTDERESNARWEES